MAKGGRFENEMSKAFSLWWTNGRLDDVFDRSKGSGSSATMRMKKGKKTSDQYGDMTSVRPIGKPLTKFFLAEFKAGYAKTVGAMMTVDTKKKVSLLEEWWLKAEMQADESDRKEVFIVLRRNRRLAVIILSHDVYRRLASRIGPYELSNKLEIRFVRMDQTLVILPLRDFFKWCSSVTMRKLIKARQ